MKGIRVPPRAIKGQLLVLQSASNPVTSLSDAALISACVIRDRAAFAELFRRHVDRVYRTIGRLPGVDSPDLEDLVQTTFLEVYRTASGYRAEAPVEHWILGIAVNVARHHVRGDVRRRSLNAAAATIADKMSSSRPDENASLTQLMTRLQLGLAALPEDLQLAFTMCELEGMRGADAARILGMREGTLWRKLHEARMALRDSLESKGTG